MQAVIFIGIQASGKTTFYRQRFFDTHVRISLDQLHSLHRQRRLLEVCLETGQRFVIDNTNASAAVRAPFISAARAAGFRVVAYYFRSNPAECLARNAGRAGKANIPRAGVLGTAARLEIPRTSEGFDEIYYVRINKKGEFVVADWVEAGQDSTG